MKISPSILSGNFLDFRSSIEKVVGLDGLHSLHIDVMDGSFVPNITMGHDLIKSIKKEYPQLLVDTHLMIINPEKHVDRFIEAGVDFLSFHIEATDHPEKLLKHIKSKGAKAGLAINPATAVDNLKYIIEAVDFVLLMSVNPGFSGQNFIETTYKKIEELRRLGKFTIELDGGVNINNIKKLKNSGVDIVVAGNAVYGQDDPSKAFQSLYNEANNW